MIRHVLPNVPTETGICPSCADYDNCPMMEMLDEWWQLEQRAEEGDIEMNESMYDTYHIDEPEIKQGAVVWCPMHWEKKNGS